MEPSQNSSQTGLDSTSGKDNSVYTYSTASFTQLCQTKIGLPAAGPEPVAFRHELPADLSHLQDIARDHAPGGDVVCSIPTALVDRRGHLSKMHGNGLVHLHLRFIVRRLMGRQAD
jgi:hypothetical protein